MMIDFQEARGVSGMSSMATTYRSSYKLYLSCGLRDTYGNRLNGNGKSKSLHV